MIHPPRPDTRYASLNVLLPSLPPSLPPSFQSKQPPTADPRFAPPFIYYVRSGYTGSQAWVWAHWTGKEGRREEGREGGREGESSLSSTTCEAATRALKLGCGRIGQVGREGGREGRREGGRKGGREGFSTTDHAHTH